MINRPGLLTVMDILIHNYSKKPNRVADLSRLGANEIFVLLPIWDRSPEEPEKKFKGGIAKYPPYFFAKTHLVI